MIAEAETDMIPTPVQAETIWKVLEWCDEDGSEDVRGRPAGYMHPGAVNIFQRDEGRVWIVRPDGGYTWRT